MNGYCTTHRRSLGASGCDLCYLEKQLGKAEGIIHKLQAQRDELLAACKVLIVYAEHGPPEPSNCLHDDNASCDSICEHEANWYQAMRAASVAIAKAEEKP